MQEKLQIKPSQLFCSIILVQFGSALLLDVARDAKKDAWITLLLGALVGMVIYCVYIGLFRYYPNVPLTTYVQKIWGTYLGWFVGLLYTVYFIYLASRVLRIFTELLVITSYPNTSILLMGILLILSTSYALMKGINALGRISTICLFFIFLIIFLIILGETFSDLYQFPRLLPVLENGWEPILNTLFPTVITEPFGEIIVFTMLLPFLSKKEKALKYGIFAIAVSGIYLAISSIIHLAILGETLTSTSSFPILASASLINIADFISRIGALIVFGTVILGFFKISIFFYCAVLGASHLFKIEQKNLLILPIGLIILFVSIASARSYIAHIYEGQSIAPYYLHLPFQIILPLLLLLTAIIKNRLSA